MKRSLIALIAAAFCLAAAGCNGTAPDPKQDGTTNPNKDNRSGA